MTNEQLMRNKKGVRSVLANWHILRDLDEVNDALHMRLDVERRIKELSYDDRKLLYLLYWKDLRQKDVAKIFGVSQQRISALNNILITKIAKSLGEWL